jgi:hypothetical protein
MDSIHRYRLVEIKRNRPSNSDVLERRCVQYCRFLINVVVAITITSSISLRISGVAIGIRTNGAVITITKTKTIKSSDLKVFKNYSHSISTHPEYQEG